ncbi:MAG: dihydroorotase [Lachnospiraceae bacterium]|nr:dihydroorotase [Lachnospiraceae bacterium]
MILIKNCHLIDPKTQTDGKRDILIKDGRIAAIKAAIAAEVISGYDAKTDAETAKTAENTADCGCCLRVIDADGMYALPGLVDAHVHFRDPGFTHKEDIETGARSAAAGGVTSVVLMANTNPHVDNVETLRYVMEKGAKTGINVYTCANVTMDMAGKEMVDMESLLKAGAVGFTDDGVPILDANLARKAMEEAARLDAPISFHEENPAFIKNNGINAGKASAHFGIGGSDRQAEIDMVERDLAIALETGADVVIQHISSKEAVELVRCAAAKSSRIHAEATPHHFSLTEDAAIAHGTMAKMNPPLREEADRQAIIAALKDGTIDLIATDHAPHTAEEKAQDVTKAPSGIIGLETSLTLGWMHLVKTGELTALQLMEKASYNPAKLYKLDAGYLAEGGPADLVLFDADRAWKPEKFVSKSQNTPFIGADLTGQIMMTICKGKVVYEA